MLTSGKNDAEDHAGHHYGLACAFSRDLNAIPRAYRLPKGGEGRIYLYGEMLVVTEPPFL